jgi:CheY-like chemotaxis protein
MTKNLKPILLVEDDRVDVMTVKRALKELDISTPLKVTRNGEEALAYLREATNHKPSIILLDLNMPKMNGIEFLTIVKQDPALRRIPVVVLTTSKEEQDRVASFDLSVAGYMIKPVDYTQFVEIMRTIKNYWMLSELPE